jgi:hypothetical protein
MAGGGKTSGEIRRKSADPSDDGRRVLMRNKANAERLILTYGSLVPSHGHALSTFREWILSPDSPPTPVGRTGLRPICQQVAQNEAMWNRLRSFPTPSAIYPDRLSEINTIVEESRRPVSRTIALNTPKLKRQWETNRSHVSRQAQVMANLPPRLRARPHKALLAFLKSTKKKRESVPAVGV